MLMQMRTTLNLDSELYARAKQEAARLGTTVSALLEDALRARLSRADEDGRTTPPQLTTVRGRGLRSGVDLDDSAALLDQMERS
jgi:hypothetical protein